MRTKRKATAIVTEPKPGHVSYLINGSHQTAQGFYKLAVVDKDGQEIWRSTEWKKNLILNQGMDAVATHLWADLFQYACAGTGTRVNTVDSSTDTASQAGTTVTKTGSAIDFTTAASVGDMIHWDDGNEARITNIGGSNTVTVTPSQTVTGQHFIIYHTSQIGLQTELKRSNTYLAGSGNCQTTQVGTQLQMRRTIDFSAEVSLVNYTEVGLAWTNTGSNTVFSRILLPSPVAVDVNQKLRVIYELHLSFSPSTPNSKNLPVGGWPVAPSTVTTGQEQIQKLCVSQVLSSGSTGQFATINVLDPGAANGAGAGRTFGISPSTAALAAFGTATDRSTNASKLSVDPTNSSYTPLSFTLDCTGVFQVSEAVRSDLRSVCFGGFSSNVFFPYDNQTQAFTFLFDQNQTKTNTQTLSFTVRMTWSRVLA